MAVLLKQIFQGSIQHRKKVFLKRHLGSQLIFIFILVFNKNHQDWYTLLLSQLSLLRDLLQSVASLTPLSIVSHLNCSDKDLKDDVVWVGVPLSRGPASQDLKHLHRVTSSCSSFSSDNFREFEYPNLIISGFGRYSLFAMLHFSSSCPPAFYQQERTGCCLEPSTRGGGRGW